MTSEVEQLSSLSSGGGKTEGRRRPRSGEGGSATDPLIKRQPGDQRDSHKRDNGTPLTTRERLRKVPFPLIWSTASIKQQFLCMIEGLVTRRGSFRRRRKTFLKTFSPPQNQTAPP